MNRRSLIVAALGAVCLPPHLLKSFAQPGSKQYRVGFLTWDTCPSPNSVFGKAMAELGYVWNGNMQVLCRSAEESYNRLKQVADLLASENVDVIVALTHTMAYAAHKATRSIPTVMIASGDPIKTGLVSSLNRPGGNITGLTYYSAELIAKRLELLKEIVPSASRIAVLGNSESDHVFGVHREDTERAARTLAVETVDLDLHHLGTLEKCFSVAADRGAEALLVLTDSVLRVQASRVVELAATHRLAAMYWGPWFSRAGGLATYSADYDAMVRRAAQFVDKVLRGARPADLPVEQPTTFKLVINLKTAKALGLTIPATLLARADEVIE